MHYLALLITGVVLSVAMTPVTQTAQVTQKPLRGRHNGKIVFISDRDYKGLSVWSPVSNGPTELYCPITRATPPSS